MNNEEVLDIKVLLEQHELSIPNFRRWMGWTRTTVHRKLTGQRAWTMDEIEHAATWLRANSVPITDGDVRAMVRTA